MKNDTVKTRIRRIQKMEVLMNKVSSALHSPDQDIDLIQNDLQTLENYYETDWMDDYQADEKGELPENLKRGVLSQDTLYDLLHEADQIRKQRS